MEQALCAKLGDPGAEVAPILVGFTLNTCWQHWASLLDATKKNSSSLDSSVFLQIPKNLRHPSAGNVLPLSRA